jgi:farnesyl-diphosphate farnesyltransferase
MKTIQKNRALLMQESNCFGIPISHMNPPFSLPILHQHNINRLIDVIKMTTALSIQEKIHWLNKLVDSYQRKTLSPDILRLGKKSTDHLLKKLAVVPYVFELFLALSGNEQALSLHQIRLMIDGVILYLNKDIITLDDLNEYSYHAAGVIGEYIVNHAQSQFTTDNH